MSIRRVDDFKGSSDQYIYYLESKVKGLEDQIRGQSSEGSQELSIVEWTYPSKRLKRANPAWKKHAERLIALSPTPEQWIPTLQQHGLSDIISNGKAIAHLLGDGGQLDTLRKSTMVGQSSTLQPESALLDRVSLYAQSASQQKVTAEILVRLSNFQKFLVVSACAVLRNILPEVPEKEILNIVRICVGDHSDDYCRRMLRVAVYLNTLIDVLNVNGWDKRAGELVLLCEISIYPGHPISTDPRTRESTP